MNFTKIKYDGKRVHLKWVEADDGEHALKHFDEPHPDFIDALQALAAYVVSMCRPAEFDADFLTVRGVTIKMDENGDRALVITALHELDWIETLLVLNTPYASETLVPRPEGAVSLGRMLDALEDAAEDYVNGKRAQGHLFDDPAEVSGFHAPMMDKINELTHA